MFIILSFLLIFQNLYGTTEENIRTTSADKGKEENISTTPVYATPNSRHLNFLNRQNLRKVHRERYNMTITDIFEQLRAGTQMRFGLSSEDIRENKPTPSQEKTKSNLIDEIQDSIHPLAKDQQQYNGRRQPHVIDPLVTNKHGNLQRSNLAGAHTSIVGTIMSYNQQPTKSNKPKTDSKDLPNIVKKHFRDPKMDLQTSFSESSEIEEKAFDETLVPMNTNKDNADDVELTYLPKLVTKKQGIQPNEIFGQMNSKLSSSVVSLPLLELNLVLHSNVALDPSLVVRNQKPVHYRLFAPLPVPQRKSLTVSPYHNFSTTSHKPFLLKSLVINEPTVALILPKISSQSSTISQPNTALPNADFIAETVRKMALKNDNLSSFLQKANTSLQHPIIGPPPQEHEKEIGHVRQISNAIQNSINETLQTHSTSQLSEHKIEMRPKCDVKEHWSECGAEWHCERSRISADRCSKPRCICNDGLWRNRDGDCVEKKECSVRRSWISEGMVRVNLRGKKPEQ